MDEQNVVTSTPQAANPKPRFRVGTLSMALILIMAGVIMLISIIVRPDVIQILLSGWPVIMIILGLEILLHAALSGRGNQKIRYDWVSVFFVIPILLISMCVYSATAAIGTDTLQEAYSQATNTYRCQKIDDQTLDVSGAKELTVNGSARVTAIEGDTLSARRRVVISYNLESAMENAVQRTNGSFEVVRSGDSVSLVSMFPSDGYTLGAVVQTEYFLTVPRDVRLNLNGCFGCDIDPKITNVYFDGNKLDTE